MIKNIQNWLVIGISKNWETALSQPVPIWGLKHRYQAEFQTMNVGDFLWLYSTSPVGGIIGIGIVKDKYIDNINLTWDEELKNKKVIWPLRFRIHVLKVLPQSLWKTHRIKINDFKLFWQVGFQLLSEGYVMELFKRTKESFDVINVENLFTGTTIIQPLIGREEPAIYTPDKELTHSHKELQSQIAEIGKLQFYYTETEYSIELPGEKKNIDVVWKREIDGAPTFAFEVELSGMFEKAIGRLEFAFRRWNTRPRLVVQKESINRVYNIIEISDKNFAKELHIYEPVKIAELLSQKLKLKNLEQNLRIY